MILVFDCNNICHMALHTTGGLSYHELETGVVFGFLRKIFKLIKDFNTDKAIFCWDSKKSYRKQIDKNYKAQRDKSRLPEEEQIKFKYAFKQFNDLRRYVLPKLGFSNNFIKTGYEADDLIAEVVTIVSVSDYDAAYGGFEPHIPIVVSGDTDLWQLLNFCNIYNPRNKKLDLFTKEVLFNERGVDPYQWQEARLIAGDSSDNISGVPGVGEKTAIRYIKGELPDGKKKQAIEASKDTIEHNRKLMFLPYNGFKKSFAPSVDFTGEQFRLEDFTDLFTEYDFRTMLAKKYIDSLKKIFNFVDVE